MGVGLVSCFPIWGPGRRRSCRGSCNDMGQPGLIRRGKKSERAAPQFCEEGTLRQSQPWFTIEAALGADICHREDEGHDRD